MSARDSEISCRHRSRLPAHCLCARTSLVLIRANPMFMGTIGAVTQALHSGRALMGTVIYYHCREPRHLAAPSRMGLGGIVFRHGTAAYCDGIGVDGAHHWLPTGGVPIETLFTTQMQWGERDDDGRARAGYVSDAGAPAHPLTASA